ncbi:MAG: hypothetical protein LBL09_01020 [Oscillospiraceae bacterium]|nr:hypothetical protein [Oscillospiraceae bacterium]
MVGSDKIVKQNQLSELDVLQEELATAIVRDFNAWYADVNGRYANFLDPGFRASLVKVKQVITPNVKKLVEIAKEIGTICDSFGNDKSWSELYMSAIEIIEKIAAGSVLDGVVINNSKLVEFDAEYAEVQKIKASIQRKYKRL